MRIKNFLLRLLPSLFFYLPVTVMPLVLVTPMPKDEVPQLGNLVFRFNKSLVKDSMLNVWDSADYISFEPRIAGRFRWESPDQLVFSPSQPLAPATTYNASVKSAGTEIQ